MSTPFLSINNRDGGAVQVRVYAGCQVSNQGVTFGVLDVDPTSHQCKFWVMQFGGNDDTWLATDGTSIYRTTDAGASPWTLVQALNVPSLDRQLNSGFHVIDIAGVPTACMFYGTTTSGTFRGYTSVDGITWVPQGPFAATGFPSSPTMADVISYHGRIAMVMNRDTSSPTTHYIWSPGSASIDSFSLPQITTSTGNVCYAIFHDQLHVVWKVNASAGAMEWRLYDLTTGAPISLVTLSPSGAGSISPNGRPGAFVDPATGDLICWLFGNGSWLCKRVDAAYNVTDITTAVRPLGFPTAVLGRMLVYIDQEANIGGAPRIYLYIGSDGLSGTSWSQYEWQGVATNMGAAVDSGGNVAHAMGAINRSGGGPYTWVSGETRIRIVSWTGGGIASGVRITFKLYSPSGTQSCKVSGFNRSRLQPDTRYPSKLMNPSHGALSGATAGNFNTGLTADNGVTTYQVTIDLEDQGRANFERSAQVLAVTNT